MVIRADAYGSIGIGHLMRCATLAAEFAHDGWEVCLACAQDSDLATAVFDSGRILPIPDASEPEVKWLQRLFPDGCDLLVVDHYGWSASQEAVLRKWAAAILVIDDLADRPHACDVLLDQTVGRDPSDYATRVPESCRLLTGADFALLRPQFASCREASQRQRTFTATAKRILVSIGGTDPSNTTAVVLEALARSGLDLDVDVVLGWNSPHAQDVENQIRRMPQRAKIHQGVTEIAPLMVAADLAVGAAGASSWERCCLGLPTLLIQTANNQSEIARRLHDAGAVLCAGNADTLTVEALAERLIKLACDSGTRRSMSAKARSICDGLGARRTLIACRGIGNDDVWLRQARESDGELLWSWQRHPDTRRFAHKRAAPSWEEHRSWLRRKLADPRCCFNIIVRGGEPAGVLRFDRVDDNGGPQSYVISINVAPEWQGQGIGRRALELRRALLPEAEFFAKVLPGNQRSERLFEHAGFVRNGAQYRDSLG